MQEDFLKCTMFQTFTIHFGNKSIREEDFKSEKIVKLFAYLIIYEQRTVNTSELIELIYDDDVDNPIGALKNLIYRLRKILKEKIGIEDLIVTGKGSYSINEKYMIDLDVYDFEKCNINIELNKEDHKSYEDMMELYKGNFLSSYNDDSKILSRSTYYHSLYIARVIDYCHILENDGNYEKMEVVARQANAIDKYNERLLVQLILALYLQKKYREAINTYRSTINFLYHYLGVGPSDELLKLYDRIQVENHDINDNIMDITSDLNNTNGDGGMLCEYGAFRNVYDMQSRILGRLGASAHVCLITLENRGENNHRYEDKIMDKIQEELVKGLRTSDTISRYSTNQFVVLLAICNYEDSYNVLDRVLKKILKNIGNKDLKLNFQVQEVENNG